MLASPGLTPKFAAASPNSKKIRKPTRRMVNWMRSKRSTSPTTSSVLRLNGSEHDFQTENLVGETGASGSPAYPLRRLGAALALTFLLGRGVVRLPFHSGSKRSQIQPRKETCSSMKILKSAILLTLVLIAASA